MNNEFSTNRLFYLQKEKERIEKEISQYVGIVPSELYESLDKIELQILKTEKAD